MYKMFGVLPSCKILEFKTFCISSFRFCSNFSFGQELCTEIKLQIEKKWQQHVITDGFDEMSTKKKFYVLSMFPYPSGNLHMGHVRVYTISDAISRFHRLNGKNVLQPIGFDAFGLPAENAARDRGIPAQTWTENNITAMRKQLKSLGFSFDWNREVITCSPDYYKFTQYLFLLMYEKGLVYRDEAVVNWDPIDKTVLAEEQVDSEGRSWRSGAIVEKKYLKQWFIRTTYYAQSLLTGLDDPKLNDWKDVIPLQKHWIGDCEGASFIFKLFDANGNEIGNLDVWIRYPEMISYSSFLAVSPDSVLGEKINKGNIKVFAKSPFSVQKLPVIVSNSLTYPEGCESKLGTPCFSEEDTDVANSHRISYKVVSQPHFNFDERLRLCNIALKSKLGGAMRSSKLRDWLISRQRRWGTPIPIVHCDHCGPVPVPLDDLPVCLPSESYLQESTPCPKCGGKAIRESDTMDTFVDSAWYFLRYADPHNSKEIFSQDKVNSILPVDVYVGGKEHAVLHLYYARFVCHFLHSIGLIKQPEPFERLLVQGMVTGKTYLVKQQGKYVKREDVIVKQDGTMVEAKTGHEVVMSWEKMSKSRFNGVEPENVLKMYGTDTTRLLILADVAPTSQRRWSDDTFAGILNWQRRLWVLMNSFIESRKESDDGKVSVEEEHRLCDARNFYIKGTTFNYAVSHQLSVAISKMQGFTNSLKKCSKTAMCNSLEFERSLAALIIMLSPMAPHFGSELWSGLQSAPGRLDLRGQYINWDWPLTMQSWPTLDANYNLPLVFKVNNAVKATIKMPLERLNNLDNESALRLALQQDKVRTFINGCDILKHEYDMVDCYEATLNICIDHLQKKKLKQKAFSL